MTLRLPIAFLFALAFTGPMQARDAKDTKTAHVGQTLILKFPGNRDAGYRWRLNKEQSTGLDLVKVESVGWLISRGRSSIFFKTSGVMNVSVTPKAPGQAELAFDYFRLWGHRTLIRTEVIRVMIKPAVQAAK